MPSTLRSGTRAFGQLAVERDVDRDRAVLHGRIDAGHHPVDDAIARVDAGLLADLNVLGLRFRDLDFRLEPTGIRDAGEVGAGRDLLAHFHRDDLEHAVQRRRAL